MFSACEAVGVGDEVPVARRPVVHRRQGLQGLAPAHGVEARPRGVEAVGPADALVDIVRAQRGAVASVHYQEIGREGYLLARAGDGRRGREVFGRRRFGIVRETAPAAVDARGQFFPGLDAVDFAVVPSRAKSSPRASPSPY